ncbi:MAG: DUF58 domain-containing protein [Chloroflexi bacterium]|nr:DUF58 domain-containing protein [Chloroflexota bacterium]
MTGYNARPVALYALIFVLLIVGLATLNGGVIALAIPPALYLGLALLNRPGGFNARAVRTLSPAHVAPGQTVDVKLVITVDGSASPWDGAGSGELLVQDNVPAGLEIVSGDTGALAPLQPGVPLTLEYSVRGARGEFIFSAATLTVHDVTGVYQRRATVAAPASLLIRPSVRKLRPLVLRPPRTHGFAGPIPARQSGSGVDFFGLRQYQSGDRLRWVNWRVSARHERSLFTNEYEQERIADVGLILDARAQTDVRTPGDSLYDHSIQAAASLADMLLDQGNRVGLLIYGRGREGVFPGYGNRQRERIYRALGRTAAGHNYALESLMQLPVRFFPAGSQIIFIGPLTGADDGIVLTRMRANGYSVIALSPDPVDFELASLQAAASAHDARDCLQSASRIAQVERQLAVAGLRRVGVQVVDWRVTRPLDQALHESLARQPLQSRPPGRGPSA